MFRVLPLETAAELEAVRLSIRRGRPFGSDRWIAQTAGRLNLQSTLRPHGRPRKTTPKVRRLFHVLVIATYDLYRSVAV